MRYPRKDLPDGQLRIGLRQWAEGSRDARPLASVGRRTYSGAVEDPYRDEGLVAPYDIDNPGRRDHAYFQTLANRTGARLIVDLGCGTGLLTRSLAAPDRLVIGVDPSTTMLDYVRGQPGADEVLWMLGDANAIRLIISQVDLAICTGNAIMHVSPDDLPLALATLAEALRPGGIQL